jgi:hypothetical protein
LALESGPVLPCAPARCCLSACSSSFSSSDTHVSPRVRWGVMMGANL